jgi:hypothetical protein
MRPSGANAGWFFVLRFSRFLLAHLSGLPLIPFWIFTRRLLAHREFIFSFTLIIIGIFRQLFAASGSKHDADNQSGYGD